ncbi:hypothetical protein Btru_067736, partial [Bulinus truncatus]
NELFLIGFDIFKVMFSLSKKLIKLSLSNQLLCYGLMTANSRHKRDLHYTNSKYVIKNEEKQKKDSPDDGSRSLQSINNEPTLSFVDKPKQVELLKQDVDSCLPNHDPQRITSESQKQEFKARSLFEKIINEKGTDKATFLYAVNTFISQEALYRRGAVEFIYSALNEMKRFGVNRDLTSYKALLQVFPEGKMIPRNVWQVEFMHYPRQQQCGIDLLEQMEVNGIIPDDEFRVILNNRFGSYAHITKKLRRMMYWMPKFKNINPYPVPYVMPSDPIQIALLMLKRMSVDKETKFTVLKSTELDDSTHEDTFVVSAQSPIQQELLSKHNCNQQLFVEGPFPIYLRYIQKQYFLLRAEPDTQAIIKKKKQETEEERDTNMFEWINFFEEEYSSIKSFISVHEQEDGTILAICITGTSSKSSVQSWIRWLENSNPNLSKTPVLFKISSDHEMEMG